MTVHHHLRPIGRAEARVRRALRSACIRHEPIAAMVRGCGGWTFHPATGVLIGTRPTEGGAATITAAAGPRDDLGRIRVAVELTAPGTRAEIRAAIIEADAVETRTPALACTVPAA